MAVARERFDDRRNGAFPERAGFGSPPARRREPEAAAERRKKQEEGRSGIRRGGNEPAAVRGNAQDGPRGLPRSPSRDCDAPCGTDQFVFVEAPDRKRLPAGHEDGGQGSEKGGVPDGHPDTDADDENRDEDEGEPAEHVEEDEFRRSAEAFGEIGVEAVHCFR